MDRFSRRSVLATILPASLLAIVLPGRAKAAADQPHMQVALESLRAAKHSLEQAAPDKGGHRGRAIKLVNQAMEETEKGMRYDRRH